ncbi:hypothetical protein ACWDR0_10505 [Streptomyces sp. NPDC003691]
MSNTRTIRVSFDFNEVTLGTINTDIEVDAAEADALLGDPDALKDWLNNNEDHWIEKIELTDMRVNDRTVYDINDHAAV